MNYIAIANSARYQLPTFDEETGLVNAVIEAPRGSRHKYRFEPALGDFVLDKDLPARAVFPFDFGFIPSTETANGEPLDILVFLEEPTFVGAVVPTHVIGVLEAEQTDGSQTTRCDRLLAVLETRYNPSRLHSIDELGQHLLAEIERFFVAYDQVAGRTFKCLGRKGPDEALRLVTRSQQDRPAAR